MSLAARCVCLTARYPICSTGAAHPALTVQRWGTLSEIYVTIGYRSKVGCGVRAMGSKQHLVDCFTASDAFSAMMPVLDGVHILLHIGHQWGTPSAAAIVMLCTL